MMTVEELNRVEEIKQAVGRSFNPAHSVTAGDKQFILDLASREQIPIPTEAYMAAQHQGYRVDHVQHNALTA